METLLHSLLATLHCPHPTEVAHDSAQLVLNITHLLTAIGHKPQNTHKLKDAVVHTLTALEAQAVLPRGTFRKSMLAGVQSESNKR